ncbi:STAS domain-containing protein [Cellulomonas algicola]|uniref:STAS domain-containing protein n=1 Tax=Cellulomonas algicola TaxID=2071633 RepID=UPI001C3FC9B3|nr:STAS domain-containing protein [Cellulomonas algicola]
MELDEQDAGTHVTLVARRRLNLVAAPLVRSRIDDLVRDGRVRIIVDLQGVASVDSSGLGALIGGLKSARQAGGDVRIAAPGEQVRAVLGLTNLDKVLTPYESVEAAGRDW